jgi:hypothetical protein
MSAGHGDVAMTPPPTTHHTNVRGTASMVLLALFVLLAISANGAWWATRTVFDTDTFVSTSESTMRQPEVQDALSNRIADAVITRGDVQARMSARLPEGLQPLAAPLTEAERSLIQRAALRLLQSPRFQALVDSALRNTHGRLVAVLEDQGSVIRAEGATIVLDLQPVAEDVRQTLANSGHDALLGQTELPPDTGRIVIAEDTGGLRAASLLAQHRRLAVAIFFLAAGAIALLSIAVAVSRRAAVRRVGLALAAAGVVSTFALIGARAAAVPLARDETAARVAFDAFTHELRLQSVAMIAVGLVIAGVAVLAGESHAARAARGWATNRGDVDRVGETRAARWPLIGGSIFIATLLVLAWPQPDARVYSVVAVILAVFIGAVVLASSGDAWATNARGRIGRVWNQRPEPPRGAGRVRRFVVREDRELELAGIVLAALALLLWPGGLTAARALMTLAVVSIWIMSIEWAGAPE